MDNRTTALNLDPSIQVIPAGDRWQMTVGWMGGYIGEYDTEAEAWARAVQVATSKHIHGRRPAPMRIPDKPVVTTNGILPDRLPDRPVTTSGYMQVI